ncbi:hypothetical protein [Rhizobium rhizogenes]|uniref:hypothetical protein n=1 Tax=Rhizobium rhizogenes TaxID=359 RepID=UPI0024BE0868|nr:hypothetical protein [Rhizobium rhizogenes]MDJ1633201.1 hypothetical protein [Rhizobium rhizogenes]
MKAVLAMMMRKGPATFSTTFMAVFLVMQGDHYRLVNRKRCDAPVKSAVAPGLSLLLCPPIKGGYGLIEFRHSISRFTIEASQILSKLRLIFFHLLPAVLEIVAIDKRESTRRTVRQFGPFELAVLQHWPKA